MTHSLAKTDSSSDIQLRAPRFYLKVIPLPALCSLSNGVMCSYSPDSRTRYETS